MADTTEFTSTNPQTQVLHAGYRADPTTGSVAVPIYQTTSYQFRDTEHAANLFALKELGNIYSRIMNPTVDVLEKLRRRWRAALRRWPCRPARRRRCWRSRTWPGGRQHRLLHGPLRGHLEPVRQHAEGPGDRGPLRRPGRPEGFPGGNRRSDARLLCRDPAEPEADRLPDRRGRGNRASFGVPLIMDNTAAPIICKPLDHGAAIVVHSTTKYIGGHGTSIGGVIVDGGNFPWEELKERQPALNTPDPSYHGAVWTEAVKPLGPIAYIIKARVTLLRDLGAR